MDVCLHYLCLVFYYRENMNRRSKDLDFIDCVTLLLFVRGDRNTFSYQYIPCLLKTNRTLAFDVDTIYRKI
jgi:phosphopantetheine adenylyltransferase